MAKKKRTSNVEPTLPPELAVDGDGPPPTADEQMDDFQQHVAEAGNRICREGLVKAAATAERLRAAQAAALAPERVAIEIPLAADDDGYVCRHVEARLTAGQARALRRLRRALEDAAARVPVGTGRSRPVQSAADAVRWLLEAASNAEPRTSNAEL